MVLNSSPNIERPVKLLDFFASFWVEVKKKVANGQISAAYL